MNLRFKLLVTLAIPLLAMAYTEYIEVATRAKTDNWNKGGGCAMKGDNVVITLMVTSADKSKLQIWSVLWNNDGTSRAKTNVDTIAEDADSVKDNAAVVCLASGGYAFIYQVDTTVEIIFFSSMGEETDRISKTAFYDQASLAATAEGGFFVAGINVDDQNSVLVYNPDGTLRKTIKMTGYSTAKTYAQRGADGTILVILVESDMMTLKFYSLDGKDEGKIEISTTSEPEAPLTVTLKNGNLVVLDKITDDDVYNLKPVVYDSSLKKIATLDAHNNVRIDRYSLIALTDGGFVIGWKESSDSSRKGHFQIFEADGSERSGVKNQDLKSGPYMAAFADGSFFNVWYDEDDTNQILNMVRLDPTGAQIDFGASCSACPVESEKSYFVGTLRYNIPFTDFISSNGEKVFIQALMDLLNVKVTQIEIISVTEGSTIIDFKIIEDPDNTAAGDIGELKSTLDNGVTSDKMNILDSEILDYSTEDIVLGAGILKFGILSILAFLIFSLII